MFIGVHRCMIEVGCCTTRKPCEITTSVRRFVSPPQPRPNPRPLPPVQTVVVIRHLIFRVSGGVTRLHRVPDRHPQPPLTLRRTTRRLVPVERRVESLVHPRPRGWIKRERVGRRPGLLAVAGAARIVEHHDGAEHRRRAPSAAPRRASRAWSRARRTPVASYPGTRD